MDEYVLVLQLNSLICQDVRELRYFSFGTENRQEDFTPCVAAAAGVSPGLAGERRCCHIATSLLDCPLAHLGDTDGWTGWGEAGKAVLSNKQKKLAAQV